jgi:hypothetical protein
MSEGLKNDENKLRVDLVPPEVIEALAEILTFGSKKYEANNWMKGIDYSRVYGAVQRHLLAWRKGEYIDCESGKPHLWHALCELSFLLYYEIYPNYYEKFNTFQQEWSNKLKIGGLGNEHN